MKTYKCQRCGEKFDTPKELNTTWDRYFSAGDYGTYGRSSPVTILVCPYCKSDELVETEVYDDELDD